MKIRLLGEVELWAAGRSLDVGAPRPQAVLAALAVDAGRPIATETLIDRIWGDEPPVEARNGLYSYLSRTRRLLRQAAALSGETSVRIERRHAGYVLDIDPDLVDLHRFRRLVDEDDDPRRDDGSRATALAEALELWRGAPLAGVPGRWAARVRDSWDRRRLDAVVRWAQLELRLGHTAALISALPDLTAEYPLAEPLEALLMRALHTAGRSAEALNRYTAVRQRLADELGTDPGPELRAVHEAILHGELPNPPPNPVATTVTTPPRPAATPEPTGERQPRKAVAGHADPAETPPNPTRARSPRRGAVLTASIALVLAAATGSAPISHQRGDNPVLAASPSVDHARAPVYLDVVVWNYEHTAGVPSPRDLADGRPDVLAAAVLTASNERHGTRATDVEQLLAP